MSNNQQSFKNAFEILKQNAAKLETQSEPDIDHLMAIVEQSTQAYKTCKERIDSVEKALTDTFDSLESSKM